MIELFLPLFKVSVAYAVRYGRRWTVLEEILLHEVQDAPRTVATLAADTGMPPRIVIEALINLLRAGWIEVRATDEHAVFQATSGGRQMVQAGELKAELASRTRWTSLCFDRLTASYLRTDDLTLVHEERLGDADRRLPSTTATLNLDDSDARDLLPLERNESLDHVLQVQNTSTRFFARIVVTPDGLEGLPAYAPPRLIDAIRSAAQSVSRPRALATTMPSPWGGDPVGRADLTAEDLIVGGPEHFALIRECAARARKSLFIHSCFVQPGAIQTLLPALQRAGERGVRVDLLWGLTVDPENETTKRPIAEARAVLEGLTGAARRNVLLSPVSSGSHAKLILHDGGSDGGFEAIIGSCNWLSTRYDQIELSLRCRGPGLAAVIASSLASTQLPAAGPADGAARRLMMARDTARRLAAGGETGGHRLHLLQDADHYAVVTQARDEARREIMIGCDLYGAAAATAVLPPMQTAAEDGIRVSLLYQRTTRQMQEQGLGPPAEALAAHGIALVNRETLHGKFLAWDDEALAVTSFNWLSTSVDGARSKGAEIGILARGPGLNAALRRKLDLD